MLIATLALTSFGAMTSAVATPTTEPPPCLSEIQRFFKDGSYAAAAREANSCWASTADLNALYMELQIYRRLGYCAHVLVVTKRLLKLQGLPLSDRDEIELIAEQCREKTVPLRIQFTPSTAGPEGILKASPLDVDVDVDEMSFALSLEPGEPGNRTVHFDPGRWRLQLERTGEGNGASQPQVHTLTVDTTTTTTAFFPAPRPPAKVEVEVLPIPPTPPMDTKPSRREMTTESLLGVGTAAPAVALVISGAVLTGVGISKYNKGLDLLKVDPIKGGNSTFDGAALSSQGLAAIGASLGAGAVAITDFAGAKERALIVETATGGVLAIGAGAWAIAATRSYEIEIAPEDLNESHFKDHRPQDLAAHTLFGLGVGLATSAAVSLIVTKLRHRKGRARAEHVAGRWKF